MSRDAWIVLLLVGLGLLALVTLVFAVRLGLRLLATKRMLGQLGAGGKVAFYGSLLYTFFPLDLLPDPIYLDDIGVLAAALGLLTKMIHDRRQRRRAASVPGQTRGQLTAAPKD